MRHETGLSSALAKSILCKGLDPFLAMRSEFARFKPRKHEAVSNNGTRRDDETGIDLSG